jgi:hypothetical protein
VFWQVERINGAIGPEGGPSMAREAGIPSQAAEVF